MNVTPSVASGVLMAVRVLRYLACPVEKSNTTEGWLTRWSVKLSYWHNVVTWGLTPQRDDYLRFPRVKLEKIRKILGTDYDQIRMFEYIFTSSRKLSCFYVFQNIFLSVQEKWCTNSLFSKSFPLWVGDFNCFMCNNKKRSHLESTLNKESHCTGHKAPKLGTITACVISCYELSNCSICLSWQWFRKISTTTWPALSCSLQMPWTCLSTCFKN